MKDRRFCIGSWEVIITPSSYGDALFVRIDSGGHATKLVLLPGEATKLRDELANVLAEIQARSAKHTVR